MRQNALLFSLEFKKIRINLLTHFMISIFYNLVSKDLYGFKKMNRIIHSFVIKIDLLKCNQLFRFAWMIHFILQSLFFILMEHF